MEFDSGSKFKNVHVKNDSPVPFVFNFDSKKYTMEAGEVAYVPSYLAGFMCSDAARAPEHNIRIINESEGSLEYLQSEAKRKQAEAQKLADAAKSAMDAAEAARAAAAKAAGDVRTAVEVKTKR